MKTEKVYVLAFGLGGHSEQGENWRLSGYDEPENWARKETGDYSNTVVIDKRQVLENKPGLAVTLPMCNVTLAPDEVEKFSDIADTAARMMGGLGGSFKSLAALGMSPTFSGLDSVSVQVYTELWRKEGARIGKVVTGKIVWE